MPIRPAGPPVPVGDDRGDIGGVAPGRNLGGALTLHLLSQEQSVENTANGPVIVVSGMIEGLDGPSDSRLIGALLGPDVPRVGRDYHPDPSVSDLPVDNVLATPVPDSPDKAYVRIRYAYPTGSSGFINFPDETAPPQVEVVSAVVPMTTEFCYVGRGNNTKQNQIVLLHVTEEEDTSIPHYQVGEVEIQVPVEIVRYRRREQKNPHNKARVFVGTINMRPVFADPAHMWLCTRLGGPSDDGGLSYNVTYEFQRNVDSWDKVVVFRDPDTGYPMQILTSGDNAADPNTTYDPSNLKMAAKCRVYREMDWHMLNLTL